ncbi:MAG: helix-turn-helix transcriptional regulator, partial [Ghiorsea sp.]
VSQQAVQKWEKAGTPRFPTLSKIAKACGVRDEWLLNENGSMQPTTTKLSTVDENIAAFTDSFTNSTPRAKALAEKIIQLSDSGELDDKKVDAIAQLIDPTISPPRLNTLLDKAK